jgi:DNA-directed RNA polymerase subunit RPC12/RpoP
MANDTDATRQTTSCDPIEDLYIACPECGTSWLRTVELPVSDYPCPECGAEITWDSDGDD